MLYWVWGFFAFAGLVLLLWGIFDTLRAPTTRALVINLLGMLMNAIAGISASNITYLYFYQTNATVITYQYADVWYLTPMFYAFALINLALAILAALGMIGAARHRGYKGWGY
jgi:hypothetical protein